ncbi:hypothetical protein TB2_025894 [Malus domestica]
MNPKRNTRLGESSRQDMDDRDHEEDPDCKDKSMTMKEGALILIHMKHKVLDSDSARELENMKCKFLGSNYWKKKYSHEGTTRKRIIQETEAPKTLEAVYNVAAAQGQQPLTGELQKLKDEEVEAEGLFYGNYAPPDVPHVPRIQHLIQVCSKPFEKQLTSSDVRDGQCRFAINKEDVENHIFLLLKKGEDIRKGIHVTTYDVDGNDYPMVYKLWAGKIHVLTGGWKNFVHDHGLVEKQDFVTLWVFRNADNGSLCFVISSRRLPVYETIKKRRLRSN